ncbi:MAG: DUF192 domain-containing protein [Myxococcales bacterium]|nr:DUF192 domain-containing protein [Myxococcales bacterium]MCB9575444.1 DUF192 domain-containing protein [Polyangiaceae bacterium]
MKALPIAFALLAFACSSDPECDGTEVTITRGKSTLLRVCAEVRDTEAGRARGLSGHAPLAKDEGMLLDFPVEGEVCIVNTDVSFDIDVVYATDAGDVTAIETFAAGDAAPRCHPATRRVLEVSRGVAATVQTGDQLVR